MIRRRNSSSAPVLMANSDREIEDPGTRGMLSNKLSSMAMRTATLISGPKQRLRNMSGRGVVAAFSLEENWLIWWRARAFASGEVAFSYSLRAVVTEAESAESSEAGGAKRGGIGGGPEGVGA